MKNSICAFFDVDGTLINFNSMLSFLNYTFTAYYGNNEGIRRLKVYDRLVRSVDINNRQELNKLYYRNFQGIEKPFIKMISDEWFKETFYDKGVFNKKCLAKLKQHQNDKHCVVFVSGGFFGTLDPLARYLNVEHILCVHPIVDNGVLTGEIDHSMQTIGAGKAVAIRDFMKLYSNGSKDTLISCYAYGDHISDVDMLSMVGNPVVVGYDQAILKHAKLNNWNRL